MSTITIYQGYEYRCFLSDIYQANGNGEIDREEFYYPQYMQAAKCIDEITMRKAEYDGSVEQERERQRTRRSQWGREADAPAEDYRYSNERSRMGYPNNIIGFCAKRGQGKTSAMLTMVRALTEKEKKKPAVRQFWNNAHVKNGARLEKRGDASEDESPVIDSKYFALGTIDPTTMEKRDSILEIIVARMLQKVQDVHEEELSSDRRGGKAETERYRDLLAEFQDVSQKVRLLKHSKPIDDYDDISKISETDDSRSAKHAFVKLVKDFLRYIEADMLIVPVDDADMDPNRVYEVVEDLRKYCIVPGVIIMMAVHLDTLKTCIEQQYVKSYQHLLKTGIDTDHMKRYQCREMAERYVDKLIPDLHQIHLPYINDKIRDGADVKLIYRAPAKGKNEPGEDLLAYPDVPDGYQDRLARLVYEKTGVILCNRPGYMHRFMPKRYRELTHMLSFFTRLTDIQVSGDFSLKNLIMYQYFGIKIQNKAGNTIPEEEVRECLERRIRNLDQLESYFFQHWCPVNLTKNQCDKLNKIRSAPLSIKNKRTIEVLKAYCEVEHATEFFTNENERVFIDPVELVTYADVLEALAEVKRRLDSPFKYDFVYAVQMYYTIYMNKILCLRLSQKTSFSDLEYLTQGIITPFDKDYSVVKCCDNEIVPLRYLYPCDKKGYIRQEIFNEWNKQEDHQYYYESPEGYFRFDPFAYLMFKFYVLARDSHSKREAEREIKSLQSEAEHAEASVQGTIQDKISERKKIKEEIQERGTYVAAAVSTALQYICNYDLQYSVKKRVLDRIRTDVPIGTGDFIGDVLSYIYGNFFKVLYGGKEYGLKAHELPIKVTGFSSVDELIQYEDATGKSAGDYALLGWDSVEPCPVNRDAVQMSPIDPLLERKDIENFMNAFTRIASALETATTGWKQKSE